MIESHNTVIVNWLSPENYFVSYSFKIACTFVLDSELSETADTRNCNPQSFPNITDVSLKCNKGTLSFCALSSIILAVCVVTDCEITTNLLFYMEDTICFAPRVRFLSLIAFVSAFSNNFAMSRLFFCIRFHKYIHRPTSNRY